MPTVTVSLKERSYPIVIEPGVLSKVGSLIREQIKPQNALVVSNPNIASHYADTLLKSLKDADIPSSLFLVPAGDRAKSLHSASRIIDHAIAHNLERSSVIIALGGGVVGDLSGFVASIYLRGVSFVQVPTSLLADVDASVGGKTAVNHPAGKNLIGTFYQPKLVAIDPSVLKTLPLRELRAGLAEMIKHGVILDASYFDLLHQQMSLILKRDQDALTSAILGSCKIKAAIVAADEKEAGPRAFLNYGHTFGHALEAVTHYRRYKHGEAVSLGMEMAAALSQSLGILSASDALRQRDLLSAAGLPVQLNGKIEYTADDLLAAMAHDKKVSHGHVRFVLAEKIGKGCIKGDISLDAVRDICVRYLTATRIK